MTIQPLIATYQCTYEEVETLVAVHGLTCCEPHGEPFIALRFANPNEALAFKLAIPAASIDAEVAFLPADDVPAAERALDAMGMRADRFDFLSVWVWDTKDKAVFDAAFAHRVR